MIPRRHEGLVKRKSKPAGRKPPKTRLDAVRKRLVKLRRAEAADRPPTETLKELVRRVREPGATLAWICGYEPSGPVARDAGVLIFCAAEDPQVPPSARKEILEDAAPVLLQILEDPHVPDARKWDVGPLLSLCGVDIPQEKYWAFFHDPEKIRREYEKKHASRITGAPEEVHNMLGVAGVLGVGEGEPCTEEAISGVLDRSASMASLNGEAGVSYLCVAAAIAAERGFVPEKRHKALEMAAGTGSARAAWYLSELGRWPAAGAFGRRAERLAAELDEAGVEPRPPASDRFSHGLLSGVDGVGSQSVILFFQTGRGTMPCLTLLLNDEVGVKEVLCLFEETAGLEETYREQELHWGPCGFDLARELVAEAWAVHEETGRPLPGALLLYRHFLGPEPIEPVRRRANLGAYLLETMVRGPEIVESSEDLLEHSLFGDFWFASDEAYEFVRMKIRRRPGGRRGAARSGAPLSEDDRKVFAREVGLLERDVLARRLAANLEVEALAGRAKERLNRMAARTYLALVEDVVPFEKIPYVRALCDRAVESIAENIRMGYRNQREANEAALRADQESAEIMNDLERDSAWKGS